MDIFGYVPYLAIAEKRKDLLVDPLSASQDLLYTAVSHLRMILYSKKKEFNPVKPSIFFLEANLVAFSPSSALWERFAKYYATLAIPVFQLRDPLLEKHYRPKSVVSLRELLSTPRPFPQLRLYHLEVSRGNVYLKDREPFYRASLLYRDILRWIEEKVRKIVLSGVLDPLREYASKVLRPPSSKKKGYPFIQRILSAVGIPDGRKRILFFWLIPYWVSVEGRSPEEVLDLANEWLSRQSGGKIYSSWILSEAENVRSKGIKPWSLSKVERIDPELVKLLRGMGIL